MTNDNTPSDPPPPDAGVAPGPRLRPWSRMAMASIVFTGVVVAMVALSGPAYRLGLIDVRTAIDIMRLGGFAAVGGVVFAILGMVFARPAWGARGMALATLALIVNVGIVVWLGMLASRAAAVPAIHDITTNIMDPPRFETVVALRTSDENSTEYAGVDAVGRHQARAYPDLEPVYVMEPVDEVFDRALETARDMGWKIVAHDRDTGRIEAVDTTFWFGFKDDVVIRVRSAPMDATSLDLRSASRVGVSDIGVNAQRIRAFLKAFGAPAEELSESIGSLGGDS